MTLREKALEMIEELKSESKMYLDLIGNVEEQLKDCISPCEKELLDNKHNRFSEAFNELIAQRMILGELLDHEGEQHDDNKRKN